MEVDEIKKLKTPDSIHGYWPRYISRTMFFVVAMQIIAILLIAAALLLFHIAQGDEPLFWITLTAMLFATTAINILTITVVTEPIKQLTAALAKSQGEQSPLPPPNPNVTRYEKNGLKPLLRAIYETKQLEPTLEKNTDDTVLSSDTIANSLSETKSGIMMFNAKNELVYSNSSAPVRQTVDGKTVPDLEFNTDETLESWIEKSEKSALKADKIWTRIATKAVGEDGRKLYDISASYRKGSTVPVVLFLVEKTAEYSPEDDDLNFIAFAAHELRGPITVIRGYLDTLQDELSGVIDNEQKELFERLIVSANRLSSYINNILNSSRYDRRHLSVHLIETNITSVYNLIADDMQLRASAQQRLLHIDLPVDLPKIAADPTSLSEVIGNLIDNAIKYSNEGGVILVSAEQHDTMVEFSVRDEGIGMPANVVSSLFHKFYRSHRSRETVAGTGIGLYISKAIIESHGGTISVQSLEGEGSTFTFSVPIYSTVASKLAHTGNNNAELIANRSGGWIKNHGVIRG